jgi:hypothetical protein
MLFGEGLNGNGFVGNHPSLSNLDNDGNLQFTTDFRDIYATILEDWLCINPTVVDTTLMDTYTRANLGIVCTTATTTSYGLENALNHKPIYKENSVFVAFSLPTAMHVQIELINILGQNLGTIHNERHIAGTYEINLNPQGKKYTGGQYIYRIIANGNAFSKAVVFVK